MKGVGFTSLHSVKALGWNQIGFFATAALRFVVTAVLARILGPGPFGQVAIAILLIGFGNILVESGFSALIVKQEDISDAFLRSCFTIQLGVGLLLTILGITTSSGIARLFSVPEAWRPLALLSTTFVLSSAGMTSRALLSRGLEMRYLQSVQILAYFLGYAVTGIPLAMLGAGVWSLVIAQLIMTLASTTLYLIKRPISFKPSFRGMPRQAREQGLQVMTSGVTDWFVTNSDSLAVGYFLGPTTLAFYNRSYFLAYTPANALISGAKGVFFPVVSRKTSNNPSTSKIAIATILLVAGVSSACFTTMSFTSNSIVQVIYGSSWTASASILEPMSLAMIPIGIGSLLSILLWVEDGFQIEARIQLLTLAISTPAFVAAAQLGAVEVAWTVAGAYAFRTLMLIIIASPGLGQSRRSMLIAVGIAISTAAALSWVASCLVNTIDSSHGPHPLARVAGCFIVVPIMYTLTFLLKPKILLGSLGAEATAPFRNRLLAFRRTTGTGPKRVKRSEELRQ